MSAQGVPPNTGAPQDCTWGLPETLTGWEWEGCRQRRGGGAGWVGGGLAAHPLCRHFRPLPAHPIHLNHISVPVLGFYSLWIQLQRKKEKVRERGDSRDQTRAPHPLLLRLRRWLKVQEDGTGG